MTNRTVTHFQVLFRMQTPFPCAQLLEVGEGLAAQLQEDSGDGSGVPGERGIEERLLCSRCRSQCSAGCLEVAGLKRKSVWAGGRCEVPKWGRAAPSIGETGWGFPATVLLRPKWAREWAAVHTTFTCPLNLTVFSLFPCQTPSRETSKNIKRERESLPSHCR